MCRRLITNAWSIFPLVLVVICFVLFLMTNMALLRDLLYDSPTPFRHPIGTVTLSPAQRLFITQYNGILTIGNIRIRDEGQSLTGQQYPAGTPALPFSPRPLGNVSPAQNNSMGALRYFSPVWWTTRSGGSVTVHIRMWPFTCLFAAYPLFYCIRFVRKRNDAKKGLCSKCRYDLRGSMGRCPECGHVQLNKCNSGNLIV
jgi:hypothetical protein